MPKVIYDWAVVQAYHDEGHRFVECAKPFGFSHTAWIKAIKRGALKAAPARFRDRRRKYDWSEVQAYYNAGYTYAECIAFFGFQRDTWTAAVKRGDLRGRARALCKLIMTKGIRSTLVCGGSDSVELRGIRPFGAEKFGLGRWDGR